MKVCMISHSVYAFDNRIKRYATHLAREAGVDVYSIGANLAPGSIPGENENIHVFNMIGKKMKSDKLSVYLMSFMIFFLKTFYALSRDHLFGKRYDVVHVHNLPDPLVFVALVPKLFGSRIILDIHDILPEFYLQKFGIRNRLVFLLLCWVERISVMFADHVIVANDLWREKIASRNKLEEKDCTTIMNYPNLDIFNYIERRKQKELTLVYHGTLSRIHGTDILLEALQMVRKVFPDVRMDVYGRFTETGFEKEILNKINEFGLKDEFRLMDALPHEELGSRLQGYYMGIVPKRDGVFSGEAFSTKLLEFMAVGLPVVVSRTRVDEYYFTDEDVVFFEPQNSRDLAGQIIRLFEDDAEYERIKRRGLVTARQFDWNRNKERYSYVLADG